MFGKKTTGYSMPMKTWKAGEKTDADMIDDMLKDIPAEEFGEPKRRTKSQPKKPETFIKVDDSTND